MRGLCWRAPNDSASVQEDTVLAAGGNVLANDSDSLTLSITAARDYNTGQLLVDANGVPVAIGQQATVYLRIPGERAGLDRTEHEAFRDAVLDGRPVLTGPTDSVANMAVIDAVYEAAGLPIRQ